MFTSNKAELTNDFSNRSSITRILKRDDRYLFKQFPEGDLLDHVQANQPAILGAVFTIIQAWHADGKPRSEMAQHDFRDWAKVLDWIVVKLLGCDPLMIGHREVQQRTANPALTWLRDVALLAKRRNRCGEWLRANDLLDLIADDGNMPIPGLSKGEDIENKEARDKSLRSIGLKMSTAFDRATCLEVDGVKVERREGKDDDGRDRKEYAFSL